MHCRLYAFRKCIDGALYQNDLRIGLALDIHIERHVKFDVIRRFFVAKLYKCLRIMLLYKRLRDFFIFFHGRG